MNINPLNSIEATLGNLYGSDPQGIRNVAQKIRTGLGHTGFTVVKTAQVDRLHSLLTDIRVDDEDANTLVTALEILEGWK